MERSDIRKYLLEFLSRDIDVDKRNFEDITTFPGDGDERRARIGRRIEEKFMKGFGVTYYGDGKFRMYVFTGKIFESFDYATLYYALDRWLEKLGVLAKDRKSVFLQVYITRAQNMMRDRILKKDLSIMCFENCVVDMNSLKTYPHSDSFDCTKMYPFRYDRKEIVNCSIWRRFLGDSSIYRSEGVLPDKGKQRILQMFLGACLMDRKNISFEYFLILQGSGANGKSVIYRVLKNIFGDDELLNIKLSQFSRGGDEQLRAAYSMNGKRLMYCSESARGDFKDLSMIKAISSGEPIACREIGGNISSMQRPPVMLCNSNYKWSAKDFLNREDPEDESMQRRAIILNFDNKIPVEKRDTMLAERMKSESAGIFAWIVKGLCELRKNGYRMPETVNGKIEAKLERIRSTVRGKNGEIVDGSVSEYLFYKHCKAESFEGSDPVEYPLSDIYENYKKFCKKNGVVSVTSHKFGRDLTSLGCKKEKKTSGCTTHYTLWCDNEDIIIGFTSHIPNIADDAKTKLFEGFEMTDEDFVNESFDE